MTLRALLQLSNLSAGQQAEVFLRSEQFSVFVGVQVMGGTSSMGIYTLCVLQYSKYSKLAPGELKAFSFPFKFSKYPINSIKLARAPVQGHQAPVLGLQGHQKIAKYAMPPESSWYECCFVKPLNCGLEPGEITVEVQGRPSMNVSVPMGTAQLAKILKRQRTDIRQL